MRITDCTVTAAVAQPLTFAVVADLHDCDNLPVVTAVRAIKPDAVLVAGDFVHSELRAGRGFAFLRRMAGEFPTFCSVGNHERLYPAAVLPEKVAQSGATLLDNTACRFRDIWLGGLSCGYAPGEEQGHFRETPPPDTAFLERYAALPGWHILLCHHPEYYPRYIRPLPVELTLSGHAHGGQWSIGRKGLFAPGQGLFPRYTAGLYEHRLLVTRGAGNAYPIPRIGTPFEVIRLTLTPQDA